MKNDPLKKVENYRGWKYLHRLTAGQAVLFVAMIFILLPCPCSRPHVHFFIHNSLFSTTSDSRWWPNAPRHNCGGEFFYFYLCGVNDEAALQSRTEAEERNPSLLPSAWFPCRKLHQRHNYLHSRGLFETQSPRVIPSARQRVQYTGARNAENVRAVASHREDGEGIIDKGNIYTAAQS